jgi:lambda repressor-like predicted transcriptional regulator
MLSGENMSEESSAEKTKTSVRALLKKSGYSDKTLKEILKWYGNSD